MAQAKRTQSPTPLLFAALSAGFSSSCRAQLSCLKRQWPNRAHGTSRTERTTPNAQPHQKRHRGFQHPKPQPVTTLSPTSYLCISPRALVTPCLLDVKGHLSPPQGVPCSCQSGTPPAPSPAHIKALLSRQLPETRASSLSPSPALPLRRWLWGCSCRQTPHQHLLKRGGRQGPLDSQALMGQEGLGTCSKQRTFSATSSMASSGSSSPLVGLSRFGPRQMTKLRELILLVDTL